MLARAVRDQGRRLPRTGYWLMANYTSELLDLPPGIGISVILKRVPNPVKSRDVLVEDNTLYRMGNPQLLEAGNPSGSCTWAPRRAGNCSCTGPNYV